MLARCEIGKLSSLWAAWLTHSLFLGDRLVYRKFTGMCRLDLGRSCPGSTGETQKERNHMELSGRNLEWKADLCMLALPKGVGPKTLILRSLLLSVREMSAQTPFSSHFSLLLPLLVLQLRFESGTQFARLSISLCITNCDLHHKFKKQTANCFLRSG